MNDLPTKYNRAQVALHGISALLIVFMLFMGFFVLSQTPNTDPTKAFGLKGHMIMGISVLVITVVRILWRHLSIQPPHASTGNAMLDKSGVLAHYALNILAILVALSGIGIAIQTGLPDIVFSGQGTLPEDFSAYPPRIAHGILTLALGGLIIVHILGGVYHQFILKDGLLRRMSPHKSK
ncbi:MAG: cytochrome b/b6 domain-containing protein [Magnetovibrio sp.]|nr:cytochrome b/b6 domain-containing protein [Magnetovibrio sp.]